MPDPTTPLRIAIDVGPLYGHRTGVGIATAGMVRALSHRDDVELDPFLVSFRASTEHGHRRLPVPGIVASHVWARTHRPRLDRWAAGAHAVHGTNYVVPPTSLPSVVSVYDCWFMRHPDQAIPVVRRAALRLRRAVEHGAWIHASSEATATEVRAILATERVRVVRLGPPDLPPPAPAAPPSSIADAVTGAPFVVAIGTEERRKDLPRLVRAFGLLTTPDLRLVLAGATGDATASVDAAIAELPPERSRRVVRLGRIGDSEKHWLLRRAAALAYPSLDEGFGFPIVEAQLAGTPVVASDVGSIAEVGGQGVLLVRGGDTDALAEGLRRVIDDGGLRLSLIAAGHRNARHFSWDDTSAGLVDLYRTAIGA